MVKKHIDLSLEQHDKIIVFAHHREFIDKLMVDYKDYNPVKLYGGMKAEDKQESVDKFQLNPDVRLFIGQIQASGVGITLTASQLVVFAELSWSPEELKQCVDRSHRIGQDKPVLAQFLVVKDSIESNIMRTIMSKVRVIKKILN
jgi:SWI/SNF-related matrix-associated actin-dependent regulator 1 of chromatin subfamily A